MGIYYSANTGGFYTEEIHGVLIDDGTGEENPDTKIPPNSVLVSKEEYQILISGQSSGQQIVPDVEGFPVLSNNLSSPLTSLQIRNISLEIIIWTRPSDNVKVQIRHPDYASDYLMMKEAHDNMGELDTEAWIDVDDNPILMSKQDFNDAMAHNRAEIKSIFATYISSL